MQPIDKAHTKELVKINLFYTKQPDNTVIVISPITGRPLSLRDFSNRDNRFLWDMMQKAKKEPKYEGKWSDVIRDIIAQGITQGRLVYANQGVTSWDGIPMELIQGGWDVARMRYDLGPSDFSGYPSPVEGQEKAGVFNQVRMFHLDGSITDHFLHQSEFDLPEENMASVAGDGEPSSSTGAKKTKRIPDDVYRLGRKKLRLGDDDWTEEWSERFPHVQRSESYVDTGATFQIDMVWLNRDKSTSHNAYSHLAKIQTTVKKVLQQASEDYGPQMRIFPTYYCVMSKSKEGTGEKMTGGHLVPSTYTQVQGDEVQDIQLVDKDKGKEKVREQEEEEEAPPPAVEPEKQLGAEERIVAIAAGQADGTDKLLVGKTSSMGKVVGVINEEIMRGISEEAERGSNWRWARSIRMEIKVLKYHVFTSQKALFRGQKELTDKEMDNIAREQHRARNLPIIGEGSSSCPTPTWLARKKAVLNIANPDDKCFIWSLLRGLHWDDSVRHRKLESIEDLRLFYDEIILPPKLAVPFKAKNHLFEKIETLNKDKFTFSVFYLGQDFMDIQPWYLSQWKHKLQANHRKVRHIRLGFIDKPNSESSVQKGHYVIIYNWKALCVKPNKGGHGQYRLDGSTYVHDYCERCLCAFDPDKLANHEEMCRGNKPAPIVMPTRGTKDHLIRFSHWKHKLALPFVIYADFEALLEPSVREGDCNIKNTHAPCGWAYVISCKYMHHRTWSDKGAPDAIWPEEEMGKHPLGEVRSYFGPNAVTKFYAQIKIDQRRICSIVEKSRQPEYEVNEEDLAKFEAATHCWVCKQPFPVVNPMDPLESEDKVWDHDHFSGEFRGAAHHSCNLQITELPKGDKGTRMKKYRTPVYLHNFTGYDCYHLLKGMRNTSVSKMDCVAKSMQKFTSITMDGLQFIDSKAFLLGSLDKNVATLYKSVKDDSDKQYAAFKPVYDHFVDRLTDEADPQLISMDMFQKGVYPYEYMDCAEKLGETSLPPRECFLSSLTGSKACSEEDYARGQRMWIGLGCKNLQDYTEHYCVLDVLLLASVFERFRQACLDKDSYGLDPAYYISAPSLSWDAMLLRNACLAEPVVIETLLDPNMVMMVEKGIRGGICQVMLPYARANYPGIQSPLPEDVGKFEFDPNMPSSIITYLDANNLYGR